MENLITSLLLDWRVHIIITLLAFSTYLFNYFILRMKREYKGLYTKHLIVFVIPGFNLILLMFNIILLATGMSGYRVVKSNRTRKPVKKAIKA